MNRRVVDRPPESPMQREMRQHAEELAKRALIAEITRIMRTLQDRYDFPHTLEATVFVNITRTRGSDRTRQECVMCSTSTAFTNHVTHTDSPVLGIPLESRVSWYPEGSHGITCNVSLDGGDRIS